MYDKPVLLTFTPSYGSIKVNFNYNLFVLKFEFHTLIIRQRKKILMIQLDGLFGLDI